jgi:hypothetical protein
MSQTSRLAAILAADVAGHSRLMGADEEGTLDRRKAQRRDPDVAGYLRLRPKGLLRGSSRRLYGGLSPGRVAGRVRRNHAEPCGLPGTSARFLVGAQQRGNSKPAVAPG